MQFYTYLWLREDGTPYYIGKGKGDRAFIGHWTRSKRKYMPPPKERIVVYLAESEADAFDTEISLIWYYGRKDLGTGLLVNTSDGGQGTSGIIFTEDHKQKISKANKGKKHTLEARLKMSAAKKGTHLSEQAKKKVSMFRSGRKTSEETKKKLREAKKGQRISEEQRRKISLSMMGNTNKKRTQ
ncbi:MAG: NUMOD3 domain-containing DNA-binding protein [Halobacteriota archaeon]|jgi:hypothetical protein